MTETTSPLVSPIGIFDGGIGSYDIVRRVREHYPDQDVIYLADRARFPYGSKSDDELLASVVQATVALHRMGAVNVVLASNAPSVTVLDRLQRSVDIPVLGVTPPVKDALDMMPSDGVLAVAGAGMMINSPALDRYIREEAGPDRHRVVQTNADELIRLVERGMFLDAEAVEEPVRRFLTDLTERHPGLAGVTLSSTHLPWLSPVLTACAPELLFFDPANTVVKSLDPYTTPGTGRLVSVVTESSAHPIEEFRDMLSTLGIGIDPELIEL